MLMESFVAIMAMIGASVLHPGVYFAMNSSAGMIGTTAAQAAQTISTWGFMVTPDQLTQVAHDVGEMTILSRTGGAPTLAVGMAQHPVWHLRRPALMGIWYHFAILFEALFILTTVDAGTRVCRFMIQDLVGNVVPGVQGNQIVGQQPHRLGVGLHPVGLFPLPGGHRSARRYLDDVAAVRHSNQMLAAIALMLCTVVLFKMKRERYAWVTIVPATWLVACTVTAGLEKVFSPDPAVGFLSPRAAV